MGGLSTTGTVQIELSGDRQVHTEAKSVKFIAPVGIYYEDVLLKIRSQNQWVEVKLKSLQHL